jgi:HD-GYP domain-containing protein (c-di-GMP phosphodiesterase class II)
MILDKCVTPIEVFGKEIPVDVISHGNRVSKIAYEIATVLKLSPKEKRDVVIASRIHDYGKVWVSEDVLRKPSKLTKEEYEEMKLHAVYSSQIARAYKGLEQYGDIILYHHEKIDGSGYYGLTDKYIPLLSKIIVVADVFDALCSDRDYRNAYKTNMAIEMMSMESHKYDPYIFESLLKVIERR